MQVCSNQSTDTFVCVSTSCSLIYFSVVPFIRYALFLISASHLVSLQVCMVGCGGCCSTSTNLYSVISSSLFIIVKKKTNLHVTRRGDDKVGPAGCYEGWFIKCFEPREREFRSIIPASCSISPRFNLGPHVSLENVCTPLA